MIKKDEMMSLLLEAYPSFRNKWGRFLEEWRDESNLPLHLALAEFARHLIGMLEGGESEQLRPIFEAVERLLREGDHYVREAVTVGLIEDLQNKNIYTTAEPTRLREFLLPESARWWERLNDFELPSRGV